MTDTFSRVTTILLASVELCLMIRIHALWAGNKLGKIKLFLQKTSASHYSLSNSSYGCWLHM